MTKGAQDALGDIADFFECMAKLVLPQCVRISSSDHPNPFRSALSPPPPYPRNHARFQIAFLILMPVMLAIALVPAWIWCRGASFGLGFGFFGQPIIDRGVKLFVEKVPDWKVKLDIRK
jgi:hypothetical protein